MSTWNDNRLDELSVRTDENFKEVKAEIKDVRTEVKQLRQGMQEGFARTVSRDAMNQALDQRFGAVDKRISDLTRWVQLLVVVVGGAIVGNGIFG